MPANNTKKNLTTRAIAPRPSTLREDDRSVEFVVSTEEPAVVFDYERMDFVPEVLVQSGMVLPSNKQVPFQDSHSRESVTDVLGSFRDLRQEGSVTVGRAYFSRRQKAYDAYQDVKDGHITDVSVGYEVTESTWIPEGTRSFVGGREYAGPVRISTRWNLKEVSLVSIGADKYAKVRAEAAPAQQEPTPEKTLNPSATRADKISGGIRMNSKLYQLLISRGLAQGSTDEEALAFLNKLSTKDQEELRAMAAKPDASKGETTKADIDAVREAAQRAERVRIEGIRKACEFPETRHLVDELIASGATVEAAQKLVIEELQRKATPLSTPRVTVTDTDGEKFTRAATDAMLIRALGARAVEKPADGADQMRGIGFYSLASECLRKNGINPAFMGRDEVITRALKLRSSSSIPSQNSGDFSYILANVANKAMMVGYNYAPSTYQLWCSIGSLPDFKSSRRVRLSDAPNLLETAEGAEIQHGVMSDTGESIQLVTYARKLVITRQALINDDLGAFDQIFRAFGARAANLVNSLPYAILAANANLADSVALFSTAATRLNDASAGAAISSTTLGAGTAAMFGQSAPNGVKLNISPRFLLTGAAYKTQAEIVTGSVAMPDATYSAGVKNPFNTLVAIADANIPGNAWYLAADPMLAPTVEVAFLNGNQAPTLTQEDTSTILGVDFTAFIDATAKALDFRGLYRNTGA